MSEAARAVVAARLSKLLTLRLMGRLSAPYYRLTRGMTLGAQGIVTDAGGRVLLVRHGYQPGWHFPGGGVEWGETLYQAVERELAEETGVRLAGPVRLHGMFANFHTLPTDHVAVFLIDEWHQPEIPAPNSEIVEQGFFAREALPEGTSPGTLRRIAEIFDQAPISPDW